MIGKRRIHKKITKKSCRINHFILKYNTVEKDARNVMICQRICGFLDMAATDWRLFRIRVEIATVGYYNQVKGDKK